MRRELLILGPSARAAAASAMRAGLRPTCVDLFADRDLMRACPCVRIGMDRYPEELPAEIAKLPPMPYLLLGGLENQTAILDRIDRPRWGMPSATLRALRQPESLRERLGPALSPRTIVRSSDANWTESATRWLWKSNFSAAGLGVRFARPEDGFNEATHHFQEYVEGMPASAVFVADSSGKPRLLGVTRQLIGTPWLRSSGFLYAGNVGPWPISEVVRRQLDEVGERLKSNGLPIVLRGIFGIDFILREDDRVCVVEVNPRYPASVDVLERTSGEAFLAYHRAAFEAIEVSVPNREPSAKVAAKGILYARESLVFPNQGPWMEAFDYALDDLAVPYADIPHPGDRIEKGQPILTLFASADDPQTCLERLHEKAGFVESRLFSAAK